VKATNRHQSFATPRHLYTAFRELLVHELESDNSPKAKYLLKEFESKLLDPEYSDPPAVRRERAINKWLACEVTNRETNVRLMHMSEEDVIFTSDGFPVDAPQIADTARRFVASVLGDTPDFLRGSFSGGASTSVKRGYGTIARKYLEGSDITEGAIMHFLALTRSVQWAPRDFRCVRGNVMFTVPKSTVIDRCACKEPDYNMYVQKAIGDSIRRRLKRVGVDLNDQTLNQRLAFEGSSEGNLATVDLSSASDSVTYQLVLRLLPDEWYYLMDDVRSPETRIDGEWHLNEMFSSMGNAFTFELESLLFWAITRAVAYHLGIKGRISVYGDDIICPVGIYSQLVDTLAFFGFTVNAKKSFSSGPFRESCGKHYNAGVDITPFYVRKVPVDVSDWIHLLNSLRRWADSVGGICDPRYHALWDLFSETVPKPLHGGDDMDRRDILVRHGIRPLARLVRKQRTRPSELRRLQLGCYLHWLDVTDDRPVNGIPIETSVLSEDGELRLNRLKLLPRTHIPLFPQELGVM
jgi:hypothetical protein